MAVIVLHPGLFGGDFALGPLRRNYFRGIDRAIASSGHRVLVSRVHPTAGIEKRAGQLRRWIVEHRPGAGGGQRLTLLAHSLGGMDGRYLLARLDGAELIDTLITLSTPHRGSPYADYWMQRLGRRMRRFQLPPAWGLDVQGVADLTAERCARFNETIRDVPGVRYYSVSAACPRRQAPAWARHAWSIVHRAEGPNDSLVSVQSAAWGTHLGTWPVDHWHAINRCYTAQARQAAADIAPSYLAVLAAVHPAR